jgi:hypothetical protein
MSQLKRILLGDYIIPRLVIFLGFFFCLVAVGRPRKKTIGHRQKDATMGTPCFFSFKEKFEYPTRYYG